MTNTTDKQFPDNWRISQDFDPQDHMMKLSGRDYLNVQNRLLWFVRDQRDFIMRGLATTSYVIRSELIEHDLHAGYAQFRTYVRDVLGNEATMYGSETAKDFKDYAEKASTKSLGRALAMLGYGTQYAPEMDEGERVVDSPLERRHTSAAPNSKTAPTRAPQPQQAAQARNAPAGTSGDSRPPQAQTTQDAPAPEMTRQQFLTAISERLMLSPQDAMRLLGVRSLDGLNLRKALDTLMKQHAAHAGTPDLSILGNGGGRH